MENQTHHQPTTSKFSLLGRLCNLIPATGFQRTCGLNWRGILLSSTVPASSRRVSYREFARRPCGANTDEMKHGEQFDIVPINVASNADRRRKFIRNLIGWVVYLRSDLKKPLEASGAGKLREPARWKRVLRDVAQAACLRVRAAFGDEFPIELAGADSSNS